MPLLGGVVLLAALLCATGCDKPVEIPPMEVKAVDAYGMHLDEQATPQQVAYVLLRSMGDDFESAQKHDHQRQKEAFRVTFSLAAFRAINKQLEEAEELKAEQPDKPSAFSRDRQVKIHSVINHWTPITSHYVRCFDADAQVLTGRMRVVVDQNGAAANVYLDVAHDPAELSNPDAGKVRLQITLVKEPDDGGQVKYWRVARVGYQGVPVEVTTQPAPAHSAVPSS